MQADTATRTLLVLILLCLLLLLAQGWKRDSGGDSEAPAAVASGAVEHFSVRSVALLRGAPLLLRSNTATGQVWKMGIADVGVWRPLLEGPEGVPSPDGEQSGRYVIRAVNMRRGPPTLIRVDQLTGRTWRKSAANDGPWVAVPNPPAEGASEAPGEGASDDSPGEGTP